MSRRVGPRRGGPPKRWKLESTSRGVLIIATLLVPLNFLAAIAMSNRQAGPMSLLDPRYIGAVLIGVLAFGAMNYFASRALMTEEWWRLMTAVLGPSLSPLVIHRGAREGGAAAWRPLLMAAALACFLAAVGGQTRRAAMRRRLTRLHAEQLFLVLGVGVFSLAANGALWSLLSETDVSVLRHPQFWLIPPALPVLAAGELNRNRLTRTQLASLRYACMLMVYLSSASEVFIRGVGLDYGLARRQDQETGLAREDSTVAVRRAGLG